MGKRILIVDDEADIREILQFNLENAGYEVDCAASAEEALEMLGPEHSLILLDVMMDGMSGFKMAEVVRKEKENQVPIIFLTARSAENDLLTGFSAGGDDYISKPFSIHEVLARVKAVMKRSARPADDGGARQEPVIAGKLKIRERWSMPTGWPCCCPRRSSRFSACSPPTREGSIREKRL